MTLLALALGALVAVHQDKPAQPAAAGPSVQPSRHVSAEEIARLPVDPSRAILEGPSDPLREPREVHFRNVRKLTATGSNASDNSVKPRRSANSTTA